MNMGYMCPNCGKENLVGLDGLDLCFQIDDFEGQYDCIVGCSICDEDVKLSISYSLVVKIEDVNKG